MLFERSPALAELLYVSFFQCFLIYLCFYLLLKTCSSYGCSLESRAHVCFPIRRYQKRPFVSHAWMIDTAGAVLVVRTIVTQSYFSSGFRTCHNPCHLRTYHGDCSPQLQAHGGVCLTWRGRDVSADSDLTLMPSELLASRPISPFWDALFFWTVAKLRRTFFPRIP